MTIWIDPPVWPAHGTVWSHLVSDVSYAELHEFAASLGIPRRGFEGDHYDVPEHRYADVVAAGARPVPGRELVRILRESGLRVQKRKHETVIQSVPDAPWLPPGGRADVITSRQDDPPATTVVVRLAVLQGRHLLVVPRPAGNGVDLPSAPADQARAAEALARLAAVVGLPEESDAVLVGYVRNTVPEADDSYPWPVPRASFVVYAVDVGSVVPQGVWLSPDEAADQLSHRHWWPLLADRLGRPA